MNALWLSNQQLAYREDLPKPVPGPGEALVRVRLAGLCGTDLELLRGYYPFTGIPGHEFVGEVVAGGEAAGFRPGTRVVGEINIACGNCAPCRRGDRTHCERRQVLGIRDWDGAFAEFLKLPWVNLHPVPQSVSDEAAVFVEPLAAAVEILEQVHIQPAQRVLVIGAGRLGQLVALVLALTGCDLQVVARYPAQQARLARRGIPWIPEEQVAGRQADVVVEASGSPDGFLLARHAVRPRGTIVLKSTFRGEVSLSISPIVVDEIHLVGSRCGPFPPALRLLEAGQVDPRPLIEEVYPLAQGLAAFENAARPGVSKILLKCADSSSQDFRSNAGDDEGDVLLD